MKSKGICLTIGFIIPLFGLFWLQEANAEEGGTDLVVSSYLEKAGDRFYETREIPGNLKLALGLYRQVIQYQPKTSGVEWKITRCYWVLAKKAFNEKELQSHYKEGVRWGKQAVKNDGQNSNSHLWYALIVGSSAMRQGVVKTLYNRDTIKSELEKAIQLDPGNTNAYVGLAGWYFYVPAILGGDREEAMRIISRAIELEPDYTSARLVRAEFLIAEKQDLKAEKELTRILAVENPATRGDGVEDKRKAAEMLKVLKAGQVKS